MTTILTDTATAPAVAEFGGHSVASSSTEVDGVDEVPIQRDGISNVLQMLRGEKGTLEIGYGTRREKPAIRFKLDPKQQFHIGIWINALLVFFRLPQFKVRRPSVLERPEFSIAHDGYLKKIPPYTCVLRSGRCQVAALREALEAAMNARHARGVVIFQNGEVTIAFGDSSEWISIPLEPN